MRWCILATAVCLLTSGSVRAQAGVDYLVVTPSYFIPEFDSFAFWKTRKGLKTEVVAVETICAHTPGRDNAEKVRGFIKLWHDSLGVQWVLLAGDPPLVPIRWARTMDGDLPCDMYFADLDGDWDRDGNGIYGEESDSVDMYADVYVGRTPASLAQEIRGIAAKWLHYELSPSHRNLNRLLRYGDTTSLNPPPGWTASLLMPPIGRYEFRDSLQSGFDVVWHTGPGDQQMLGDWRAPILTMDDAMHLSNNDRLNVLLSAATLAGDFSGDCILAALVRNDSGGSVAALGNSGLAYTLCRPLYYAFFDYLFGTDTMQQVGRSYCRTKDSFVPQARSNPVWRKQLYNWNLLGEPELPVMTDTARALSVEHPAVLDTGARDFAVTIRSGGAPCLGLVCLWKGSEVYERRWLDGAGSIPVHPRTPGELLVTITAPNHRAYRGSCGVSTAIQEPAPGREGESPTIVRGMLRLPVSPFTLHYSLFDMTGRQVMSLSPGPNDVSLLSPGIYFVTCIMGGNQRPAKLVVTR